MTLSAIIAVMTTDWRISKKPATIAATKRMKNRGFLNCLRRIFVPLKAWVGSSLYPYVSSRRWASRQVNPFSVVAKSLMTSDIGEDQ